MKRASEKSYISKRFMEKYTKARSQMQSQPEKQFKEDNSQDKAMKSEEEVKHQEDLLANISEEDLSQEEVDSDDLGDDIAAGRQPQQQMQFQMQAQQQIQPQNIMPQFQQQQFPMYQMNQAQIIPQFQQQKQQQMIQPQNQIQKSMTGIASSNKRQKLSSQPQQQMLPQSKQEQSKAKGFFQNLVQPVQNLFGNKNSNNNSNSNILNNNAMNLNQNMLMNNIGIQPQNAFSNNFIAVQQQQPQNFAGIQQLQMSNNMNPIQPSGKRYKQEIDTNVFSLSMDCLKKDAEIATGDPLYCDSCKGIFNKFSTILEESSQQFWTCEFCFHKNKVDIEQGEIPKSDTVNYILEAAPYKEEEKKQDSTKDQSKSDISVVYCMDISGSMSYRASSSGKISISREVQKRDKTRLDCVKDSIIGQIREMAVQHPDRKVGLVTFSDRIAIIGDGVRGTEYFGNAQLQEYDFIVKTGVACAATQFSNSISQCKDSLSQKIAALQTEGSTALGPAILASIAIAGEGSPGSQVIVCTDGQANIGLGALNTHNQLAANQFYYKIGEYAKDKGVTVHIVTIIGQECQIDAITPVSEITGGQIERVDPMELRSNFQDFLAKSVLATKVELKVKLHKGLEFRNEIDQNLSCNKTVLTKEFGNVNEDTDVTFEYKVKGIKELIKIQDLDLTQLNRLPFQAQIYFTALDGARCVRVISCQTEISNDKQELEKNANFEILGLNAIQQSSKLARQGDYKQAQVAAKAWDNRLERVAMSNNNMMQMEQFSNFRSNVGGVYSIMNQQRQQPLSMQQQKTDQVSQMLYSNSRINKAKFSKQN
ncbi:type a von willebrand factor domain-containing protein [Stylonychia lemnae]|uniref:Type a von willebrand factor domain-containing protein n=1 Tax=Stylonychia lemnae TaxID=5949 RepID=A0A078A0W4_STYLE|nr:type a von willebrand factor domain-containing protein [Stylonychia lemnae]|eukprot:CDW75118.1 type a von willebrand factor domain-containing protein [Stylonychia lemnae]